MTRYDVKRDLPRCYAPKNRDWELVEVPEQLFIGADGNGDPNTSADYVRAVEALYAVAYTIKFTDKRDEGGDFVVAPLEGLWWADDPEVFITREKDAWHWTMLICLPDWVTSEAIKDAKEAALAKKGNPAIADVRHVVLNEGTCAQVLHRGSYDDEVPILAKLHHEYLGVNGLEMSGLHHEIYLSDPRRTEPVKLKTILSQPVKPAS